MSDEDLDPISLSLQLDRVSGILETVCKTLQDRGELDNLPDNAYDWWETLKDRRQAKAIALAARREELIARAMDKLTPEELEAIKNG